MTEKRGSFFRHEKDSIGNFRRGTKVPCHFSPLTLKTAPGAARTRNLQLRRLTLYPVELRALVGSVIIIRGQPIPRTRHLERKARDPDAKPLRKLPRIPRLSLGDDHTCV